MTEVTCQQTLQAAIGSGLERLDAQLLLLHAMGKSAIDRAWLLAHDDDELDAATVHRFDHFRRRQMSGEPLAYILGYKDFYGLRLKVDARVLVPRADTEVLVDWALQVLRATSLASHPQVLDLGTGSGAVALAIAAVKKAEMSLNRATDTAQAPQSEGTGAAILAIDASSDALAVATNNAQALGLALEFLQSNWFSKVNGRFHVIVSNPPYIPQADPHLAALSHEPVEALTGGSDGLEDIRKIIDNAPQHLESAGWLLLEHGYNQAASVRHLLVERGFKQVQSKLDLAGIERCSGGQWKIERPHTQPPAKTAG